MIYIKTKEEIRIIEEGGQRLAAILSRLVKETKAGITTVYLEDLANKLISEVGGRPAFKDYPLGGEIFFPSTLCISINNEVVHGSAIPSREIKAGDIVDIDIGMEWPVTKKLQEEFNAPLNPHSETGGFFTDMCRTVGVAKVSHEGKKLIRITKECLNRAIKEVKPGNTINDIARAIEGLAESHGYGVVRDLVGHGVGYLAHEDPNVFHYVIDDNSSENITLKEGMVIAIEPMINLGTWKVKTAKNGFTVLTADGEISAHFEHTIAVTADGCRVLTRY